jgi:hypothetical protein
VRILGHRVIHRNPWPSHQAESYSGTTICRTRDASGASQLLAAFRVGSARMSPDGRIAVHRSADGGRTWEPVASPFREPAALPATLDHPVAPSMAGPQIGASADGTVVLAAARMWIVPPGAPGWDADAAGLSDADTLIARWTVDGGWEAPTVVDGRRSTDEWAIPCGPPLALGEARWFFPVERHARTHVPEWLRGYHAFALRSTDDGRTWPERPDMPNDPERVVAHYDQRAALLPDGRIAAFAWAHDVVRDETLTARVSWSDDGGRTWSSTLDTSIVGGPLNPLALPDGRLLVVYPRRTAPRGIRARVSLDGGRTWAPETILFDEASGRLVGRATEDQARQEADPALWGSMWGWTFGQPVPVALDDGTVGVCFFGQVEDRVPAVHFLQLSLDDEPAGTAA